MPISFDKGTYKQGETVTIKYGYNRETNDLRLKNPNNVVVFSKSVCGSGSCIYTLPATAVLGGYKAELVGHDPRTGVERVLETVTMNVVSGIPSTPPDEGETRELDVGDYEVTWTLSGHDTLKAEITVTDTGVTCLSVAGGACYSATPPGVTISTFTVTGYLKSAVTPPTEGYLRVTTSPAGALVMVNGTSCGTTPVTKCTLSTGTKTVTFTKTGYNTVTRTVTIRAGEIEDIGTITLTPTTVTPPDAAKFGLSEIVENHLPEWITGYACAGCGARYPYICPAGYKRTECVPQANGTHGCCSTCMVAFVKCEQEGVAPPTKGYLTVNTSPTGALVTVDIVFPCGTTPVTKCELDTGTKTVKITKSGYDTVTRTVAITAGAITNLDTITLTPTAAPPVGFDDWVAKKGGKNAITGGNISELLDAYIGLEDVGFTVTGADVNKVADYYLGLG